jgi:DNA transformation protein and related proteins
MGFSPEYREKTEALLSAAVPIQTRAMFGGVGIYSDGLFFALIAEDKLYLKVDDTNRGDFEARGMEPFFPYDSPKPMGYWELPPGVIENAMELSVWVDKAIAVAEAARQRKNRKSG